MWLDSLLKRVVQPAAKRANISKRVGWHLLRHSNVQTTLHIYPQAVSQQKREANAVVVGQLLAVGHETAAAAR